MNDNFTIKHFFSVSLAKHENKTCVICLKHEYSERLLTSMWEKFSVYLFEGFFLYNSIRTLLEKKREIKLRFRNDYKS